jgi:hypothetical protein
LQETHGGIIVPDDKLTAALDLDRFHELARQADLGCNLWSSLLLAAERGDSAVARTNARQIAVLTKATIELVNRLGKAEPDDAEKRQ